MNRHLTPWRALMQAAMVAAIASGATLVLTAQRPSPSATAPRVNLDGIWNSATATPLERPAELKDKPFFTEAEAAAWEKRTIERNAEPAPGAPSRGVGTYNTFFREFGTETVKTRRTSIVTEPEDGRIPALTPQAAAVKQRRIAEMKELAGPEGSGLQDQCLAFLTAGPPMLPYSYNSNYQILQTSNAIVIHAEMIHDARVVRMDGSAHPPAAVKKWMGDSIGHWEGGTLVIDTTNFNNAGGYYGDAGGNFGWDDKLHVVERLSLLDADTLLYRFEIDNPTAFTRPWKGELTLSRSEGPIYEYACHEGNQSLPNMLAGYRANEREAAAKAKP